MKQILFTICAALLSASAWAGSYKIVVGFPDTDLNGKPAYLTCYDSGDTIATSTVYGKRCTFKGTTDKSYFARLVIDGKRCGMVVEDGTINVDWNTKIASGAPLNDYVNDLDKKVEAVKTEEEAAKIFYDAYTENKENGVGPYCFNYYLMYSNLPLAQIEAEVAKAPAWYADLKRLQGAISNAKALEATAEGKKYPDFTVVLEDGSQASLSDYVGKGSYTLVDFWASWCGPCRREIPNIKKMYEQYNGNGMNFLGVAVWDAPADTHLAMDQLQIPWPVMVSKEKNLKDPTNKYGINGIPHIIIFGPDGTIVSRGLQGEELKAKVDELMSK